MIQISPMTLKIAKLIKQNLVAIADAYAMATGKTRTQISKEFYGRGSSLDEMLKPGGPSISVDKVDDMLGAFRGKWPKEAIWPMVPVIKMDQTDRK
jgi:hypothetical protein